MRNAVSGSLRSIFACYVQLVCAVLLALIPGTLLLGQESAETTTDSPLQIKDGQIQSLQRIWIPGKDGRPLMQYTLEELRELERVYRESTQLPVSLQSAEISLVVEQGSASVQADFTAQCGGGGIVRRFDLGLKSCQLVTSPDFAGSDDNSGSSQQTVVPTPEGYQWLMLSSQPKVHRLMIQAKTVVDRSSDRHGLTLDLPMVQSVIVVKLPAAAIDERVGGDDVITNRKADDSAVTLEIRSRGGPFSLSWGQVNDSRPVGVVEAKSETVFEPFDLSNSSQSWSVTTTVSIRWVAASGHQKVRIRLPPGGQWSNLPYSEFDRFRLSTAPVREFLPDGEVMDSRDGNQLPGTTGSSSVQESEDLEVADILVIENLDPSALPTVENLSLQWRWIPGSDDSQGQPLQFHLRAPEINGIDSHYGTIRVVYPASYEFSYLEHPGTRFVDHSSTMESGSSRDQVVFGFSTGTAGVDLSFQKQRMLPTVRPIYRVHFTEDRIELTAWLHCWFDGSPTEIGWYPSDWMLDEASATVLRETNEPLTGDTEPLQVLSREDGGFLLSSRQSEPATSKQRVEQVWRLVAYRSWNPHENSRVEFLLPTFDRGINVGQSRIESGSGSLVVTSDNFLVLQQDSQTSKGIWAEATQPDLLSYVRSPSRNPLFYRFLENSNRSTWAGVASVLPQKISLDQHLTLAVQETNIQAIQRFDLRVANRSLKQLRFLAREDSKRVQVKIGEMVLPYDERPWLESTEDDSQEIKWREIVISNIPDLVGDVQLTVESEVEWESVASNSTPTPDTSPSETPYTQIEVPWMRFLSDEDVRLENRQWQLIPNSQFDVQFRPGIAVDGKLQPVGPTLQPIGTTQQSLVLFIQRRAAASQQSVHTNGIWLQTLLAGNERRDRFVVRVRADSQPVTVQLPEQAVLEKVALDGVALGQEVAPYDYNTNQVAVLLPDSQEHVLEVIYLVSQPLAWAQRLRIDPAAIVNAKSMERYYWQLITPNVFHLGWCPSELTAEWQWQWRTVWWSRVSDLDQNSLERWIGAASLSRTPTGTNSYVMSGVGMPQLMDVWIFTRFAFWFPTGMAAIVWALLILNIPLLRSPNSIVLMAGLIAATTMLWPEMSVLLGQTTIVAMALVVLVWLTQSTIRSRVKRRSIFSPGSQSFQEINGSHPSARVRQSSYSNVTTRPAAVESSGTD